MSAACRRADPAIAEYFRLRFLVEQVRLVESRDKAEPLKRLAQQPCERLCSYRDQCVSGYQRHIDALELTGQANALLEGTRDDKGKLANASRLLEKAEDMLRDAQTSIEACMTQEAQLSRRYHERY